MISIILLIFLIFFSAILSSSETALFSLSFFTVKSYIFDADNRKKLIAHLLSHPKQLLVSLMMLNIVSNILIQNTVSNIFGKYGNWILKVGTPLFLVLLFGEIIPKSIAIANNKFISYKMAPLIAFLARLLGPIRRFITWITGYISRFMFFFLKKEKPLSIDELYHIIETSQKEKVLTKYETDLAEGYLDLQNYLVKEKMKTKDEIIFYNIHDRTDKLADLFFKFGYNKIPVCDGSLDNLLGIISIKDFFINKDKQMESDKIKQILSPPLYIPETTKAWDLLSHLRMKAKKMAIVVDEYGSIVGLITQEDLIETVVGDIETTKETKSTYSQPSSDILIASGKMELSDFYDIFHVDLLSDSSIVTLGGWLTEKLEKIPQAGDKYITDRFLFYVLESTPKIVKKIYIRRLKANKND